MKTKSRLILFKNLLHLAPISMLGLVPTLSAEGIPEPSLIYYGEVRNNAGGLNVRLTSGMLVWTFRPSGGGADVVVTAQLTNLLDQFSYMMEVRVEGVLGSLQASSNVLKLTTAPTTYYRTNVTLNGQPVFLAAPAPESFSLGTADRGKVERVDLSLVRQDADSDGDGLPDWWETLYFAGNADPNADSDGDGMNNLREYRAGTNPNDAQSVFEFVHIERGAGEQTLVKWSSVASKTYTILRSPTLTATADQFSVLRTGLLATPPVNTFIDAGTPNAGPYFYLIKVE